MFQSYVSLKFYELLSKLSIYQSIRIFYTVDPGLSGPRQIISTTLLSVPSLLVFRTSCHELSGRMSLN